MVLLVEKFGRSLKFPSRLDHPSHDDEALLASFQAFRSDVSKSLSQIMLEAKPGLEFLSLAWYEKCFEVIPMVHRAFATLLVDIDYPMSKWDAAAADEYLNYSLNVLELLNKVSSSLFHLSQARLSLAHGLSLFENSTSLASKHLQPIRPKDLGKDLKLNGAKGSEEKLGSAKESIIREAFLIMKSTGILLLGFILSGLCSDGNPYVEMRNSAGRLVDPSLKSLESILSKEISENRCIVKEVEEVNAAAARLAAGIAHHRGHEAAKELSRRLEVLERLLKNLGKHTDNLFSGILAARNKLLDTVRYKLKK